MSPDPLAIKSMKLYHRVDRVYNELRALGIGESDPLSPDVLAEFDQLHYHGTAAVDAAISVAGLGPGSHVVEIGSGLGGPARHLASVAGCRVTAVELQTDLDATAADLTRRCGLADRIEHVNADALEYRAPAGFADAVVSWLAFLHIPDRETLLARSRELLRPGGVLYVEDFHCIGAFTEAERDDLAVHFYCQGLPSLEEFGGQLEAAGFEVTGLDDLTGTWRPFVAERARSWRAGRERHLAVHGEDIYAALAGFYDAAERLLSGGHLGGLRAVARKP